MFIPKEKIIIVMDASGSMAADPKLINAFQRIIWNVVMHFPHDPIELYTLGLDFKKINIDDYLNFNEKELMDLIFGGGTCLIEKISEIQNTGPKLFLTDGVIGSVEKRILSNWIFTCDYSNNIYAEKIHSISIMDERYRVLNIDSLQRILDEIDVRRKNNTIVCNEYKTISVL